MADLLDVLMSYEAVVRVFCVGELRIGFIRDV